MARIHAHSLCRFVAQQALLQQQHGQAVSIWTMSGEALNINAGAQHATFQITFARIGSVESGDEPGGDE